MSQTLRAERPVSWHPPAEGSMLSSGKDGFWVVVRHADIISVSKDVENFVSGHGVMLEAVPRELLDNAQ